MRSTAWRLLFVLGVVTRCANARSLFSTDDPPSCAVCPAGSWCAPGVSSPTACPANTFSDIGSRRLENCTCNSGFYGAGGDDCNECPEASWCPGEGAIVACPDASTSVLQSTSLDNCTCIVGHHDHDNNDECLRCPIAIIYNDTVLSDGYTWTASDSADYNNPYLEADPELRGWVSLRSDPWIEIELGGMQEVVGIKTKGRALDGSVMTHGYVDIYDGSAWVPVDCGALFETANDNSETIWTNYFLQTYEATHLRFRAVSKPAGVHSRGLRIGIVFSGGDPDCHACPSRGNGTCCDGGAEAHSNNQCITKETTCPGDNVSNPCPTGSAGPTGSDSVDNCFCVAGYYGTGGYNCTECPAGSYCPGGSYIYKCPIHSSSPVGSALLSDCVCNTGYHDHDGDHVCISCPVHDESDDSCHPCDADHCCDGGAIKHANSLCLEPEYGDEWETCPLCQCLPGYHGPQGHNCTACAEGYFCSNGTQNLCSGCPEDVGILRHCTNSTDTVCVACPGNSTLPAGATLLSECVCDAGFYATEAGQCAACQAGDWCLNGERRSCPSIASPAIIDGLPSCICAPGHVFEPSTVTCEVCTEDYCIGNERLEMPSHLSVNASVAGCGDETYTHDHTARTTDIMVVDSGTWIIQDPWYLLSNAVEVTLYPGAYRDTEEYIEVCTDKGCETLYHCSEGGCDPFVEDGRKVYPFSEREVTQVKLYFGALVGDVTGKVTVLSTGLHRFTEPCACSNRQPLCPTECDPGNNLKPLSFDKCVCEAGYYDRYYGRYQDPFPGQKICFACPIGRYCPGDGYSRACPYNTETYVGGASNASACACSPGLYDNAGACEVCPEGSYCHRGMQYTCPHCFSTLATGSTSISECIGLSVKVDVGTMAPRATLTAKWVPKVGGQVYIIGAIEANETELPPFTLEEFVPLADGQVHIEAGERSTEDTYEYCTVEGDCSSVAAPDTGDCEPGLYTNVRTNDWLKFQNVDIIVPEGVIIPYCALTECFSSFHPTQELLVYTSDDAATMNASQVYGTQNGFHVRGMSDSGSLTLRWFLDTELGYSWPRWEFRVVSQGNMSCDDGSSVVEIRWAAARESEGVKVVGTDGGILTMANGNWDIDESFLFPDSVFVFVTFHFSGQCTTDIHMTTMNVSTREESVPCVTLDEHQTELPGTFLFTPGIKSARVIIDNVNVKMQGGYEAQCRTCPKSFYCNGGEHVERCPADSNTLDVGSTDVNDCLCDAGHTGDNYTTCTPCPLDTYKPEPMSSDACTACGEYEVTDEVGVRSESQCLCIAGYTGAFNATGCTPCAQDSYKSTDGNSPCTQCPSFSGTETTQSYYQHECVCKPGYELVYSACTPCRPGHYKNFLSNDPCLPCPANTYNPHFGALDEAACSICPVGTLNELDSLVNLEQCVECPADSYFVTHNGTRMCAACKDYSSAPAGSLTAENCTCRAGFYDLEGQCEPCPVGTHKDGNGNEACTLCPVGTFEPRNGSTASACQPCAMGTYQPGTGAGVTDDCLLCPSGTYGPTVGLGNLSGCLACPTYATSWPGSTHLAQCSCIEGYANVAGVCTPCARGYYKTSVGDTVCVPCPHRTSTATEGSTSFDQCVCDVGYYATELGCAPCAVGAFKDIVSGSVNCTQCEQHQTTRLPGSVARDECLCDVGSVEIGFNESTMRRTCSSCPANAYQTEIDAQGLGSCTECFAFAMAGNFAPSIDSCVCDPSFVQHPWYACECAPGHFLNGSACAGCPIGTYHTENNTDMTDLQEKADL